MEREQLNKKLFDIFINLGYPCTDNNELEESIRGLTALPSQRKLWTEISNRIKDKNEIENIRKNLFLIPQRKLQMEFGGVESVLAEKYTGVWKKCQEKRTTLQNFGADIKFRETKVEDLINSLENEAFKIAELDKQLQDKKSQLLKLLMFSRIQRQKLDSIEKENSKDKMKSQNEQLSAAQMLNTKEMLKSSDTDADINLFSTLSCNLINKMWSYILILQQNNTLTLQKKIQKSDGLEEITKIREARSALNHELTEYKLKITEKCIATISMKHKLKTTNLGQNSVPDTTYSCDWATNSMNLSGTAPDSVSTGFDTNLMIAKRKRLEALEQNGENMQRELQELSSTVQKTLELDISLKDQMRILSQLYETLLNITEKRKKSAADINKLCEEIKTLWNSLNEAVSEEDHEENVEKVEEAKNVLQELVTMHNDQKTCNSASESLLQLQKRLHMLPCESLDCSLKLIDDRMMFLSEMNDLMRILEEDNPDVTYEEDKTAVLALIELLQREKYKTNIAVNNLNNVNSRIKNIKVETVSTGVLLDDWKNQTVRSCIPSSVKVNNQSLADFEDQFQRGLQDTFLPNRAFKY